MLPCLALVAACTAREPAEEPEETPAETQVEAAEAPAQRLTPVDAPSAEDEPTLLAPLTQAEIEGELEPGAGCSVEQDGKALLVAVEADAIARPYGTLRHFEHAGGLEALQDGGTFTAGAITITVTPEEGEGEQLGEVLVKRATVTMHEEGQPDSLAIRAEWHCGA